MLVSAVRGFAVPQRASRLVASRVVAISGKATPTISATESWLQRPPRFAAGFSTTRATATRTTRLFSTSKAEDIESKIKAKGDEIRQLKADGVDKKDLAPHVEELLSLKAQLPAEGDAAGDVVAIEEKVKAKGDEIRKLKEGGMEKSDLAPHIEELLALKAQLPAEESKPEPAKKEKPPQKKKSPAANKKPVEEMSEKELRYTRLAKVDAMREAGVEPYEYTYRPTHTATELAAMYEGKLEGGEEDETANVAVAGRIMTRRVFGKLAFFTLQDETGTIQLQFDKKRLGDTFKVR